MYQMNTRLQQVFCGMLDLKKKRRNAETCSYIYYSRSRNLGFGTKFTRGLNVVIADAIFCEFFTKNPLDKPE
jgi:hypothetical protein